MSHVPFRPWLGPAPQSPDAGTKPRFAHWRGKYRKTQGRQHHRRKDDAERGPKPRPYLWIAGRNRVDPLRIVPSG